MPILLFTSNDIASANIAEKLMTMGFKQKGEREWQYGNAKLIDTLAPTVLDVPTNFKTDYLLVLSSHKAKEDRRMLTVHVPGNWDSADFGGSQRTLNNAYASKMTSLIKELYKHNQETGLNFEVVFEVDHHGPTCNLSIIFIEIGSSENEWKNKLAGEVVAKSIVGSINETRDKKLKTIFAVGGGHYATEFTRMVLSSEFYVGHILPKYKIESLSDDTFKQAIEKNVEKVGEVIVLKTLNLAQKDKVKLLCEKFGVAYSEI